MDQNIIQLIINLVGTGGLITLFLISEKKAAAQLANIEKINEQWQRIVEQKEKDLESLRNQYVESVTKIESLYEDNTDLRNKLDKANTAAAVNQILRCDLVGCTNRKPPFGDSSTNNDLNNPQKH